MKTSIALLCLLTSILTLSRCTSDPVQRDLIHYVNVELPRVATAEQEATYAYQSVSGDNYSSDAVMYDKIKEVVLPKYEDFAVKLQDINPGTAEVKNIHSEYIKLSQDQLEAFKLILDAIDKQDASEIRQANEDLYAAKNLVTLWRKDLAASCSKHNVVLDANAK